MRYSILIPVVLLGLTGCVVQGPPAATYSVVPAGTVVQDARVVPPAPSMTVVNPAATTTYLSPPYVAPTATVIQTR